MMKGPNQDLAAEQELTIPEILPEFHVIVKQFLA
jgi:hypothetical protein